MTRRHILILRCKRNEYMTFPEMLYVPEAYVSASIKNELARWNCHLEPQISEELEEWMEAVAEDQGDDYDEGDIPEGGTVSKIYLLNTC